MKTIARALLIVGVLATTIACATTSFQSTWKAPDAQPVALSGQKVVAFVLTKNAAARRSAEDALAREISAGGAEGIASYTLISAPRPPMKPAQSPRSRRPAPPASS